MTVPYLHPRHWGRNLKGRLPPPASLAVREMCAVETVYDTMTERRAEASQTRGRGDTPRTNRNAGRKDATQERSRATTRRRRGAGESGVAYA